MARQLFFQQAAPDGPLVPLPAGATLKNPAYAFTLRRIALDGPAAFYAGEVAAQIVSRVRGHPSNPGLMTAWDLAATGRRSARRSVGPIAATGSAACRRPARAG